jgi:hypothetical protein
MHKASDAQKSVKRPTTRNGTASARLTRSLWILLGKAGLVTSKTKPNIVNKYQGVFGNIPI